MEGVAAFSGILGIVLIVLAVLALLMPLFVFQIRDQTKAINKKLSILINILQKEDILPGEVPEDQTLSHPATQKQPSTGYEKVGYVIGRSFIFILIGLAALLFGGWLTYIILKFFNYI